MMEASVLRSKVREYRCECGRPIMLTGCRKGTFVHPRQFALLKG